MKKYWVTLYPLPATAAVPKEWPQAISSQMNQMAMAGWTVKSIAKTGSEQVAAALVVVWEADAET